MGDWHFWLGLGLVILIVALWFWSDRLKTNIVGRSRLDPFPFWNWRARWRNEEAASDLDPRAQEIIEEDPYEYDFHDPRNPAVRRRNDG